MKPIRYITKQEDGGVGNNFPHSFQGRKYVGLDIETYNVQGYSALDYLTSKISCVILDGETELVVVDIILLGGFPAWLVTLLEDTNITKIIHNTSFEYKMLLATEGISLGYYMLHKDERPYYCTLIAEQDLGRGLNNPNDYGSVVKRRLDVELAKDQQRSDWGKRPLTKSQFKYMVEDGLYLFPVFKAQWERYQKFRKDPEKESDMEKNFHIEMQALPYFCETEMNGVYFNPEKVQALHQKYTEKMDVELKAIQKVLPPVELTKSDASKKKMKELYPTGYKPPTSNNDFKRALKALNVQLPTVKDKATKKVRESLSAKTYHLVDHPAGKLIQSYTETKKLVTSYLDPLLRDPNSKKSGWIHPVTHRAHPNIRQNGTNTSRPAYNDPPLQTVPKDKEFREMIEAQED